MMQNKMWQVMQKKTECDKMMQKNRMWQNDAKTESRKWCKIKCDKWCKKKPECDKMMQKTQNVTNDAKAECDKS